MRGTSSARDSPLYRTVPLCESCNQFGPETSLSTGSFLPSALPLSAVTPYSQVGLYRISGWLCLCQGFDWDSMTVQLILHFLEEIFNAKTLALCLVWMYEEKQLLAAKARATVHVHMLVTIHVDKQGLKCTQVVQWHTTTNKMCKSRRNEDNARVSLTRRPSSV